MNYFELFGLEAAPVIDRSALSRKYIELQRLVHPDHFADATEFEKEESLAKSSAVNEAYKIFGDEDRTVEYFLRVKGILSEDEKYELPADFLMEMMDLNEKADEGSEVFKKEAMEFSGQLKADMAKVFESFKIGESGPADLQKIKEYYFKKKYINRILERLED